MISAKQVFLGSLDVREEPQHRRHRRGDCRHEADPGAQDLAAADFFTVEVLTLRGLVRYVVFFVMKLKTRTVEIAGITSEPDGAWMTQLGRNLTDLGDGFLRGVPYVILDRDPLYTAAFRRLLRDSGVTPLVLRVSAKVS
jgi:hypothetical protein